MKLTDDQRRFAAMGQAALLPGMTFIVEQMQNLVDDFRRQLEVLQGTAAATPKPKRGRPATVKPEIDLTTKGKPRKRSSHGWSSDPEERKKEMARRLRKGRANARRREAQAAKTVRMMKKENAA